MLMLSKLKERSKAITVHKKEDEKLRLAMVLSGTFHSVWITLQMARLQDEETVSVSCEEISFGRRLLN